MRGQKYTIAFVMCFACVFSASADVIYENFETAATLTAPNGWTVAYPSPSYVIGQSVAYSVTPTGNYYLTSVDLPIKSICTYDSSCSHDFTVAIYRGGAYLADEPESLLEVAHGTAEISLYTDPVYPVESVTFSGNTLLTSGTIYWIGVHPRYAQSTDLGWAWNTRGIESGTWRSGTPSEVLAGGTWEFYSWMGESAYRVNGIAAEDSVCGNGILEDDEECDDGNTYAGDCCSPTCQLPPGTWKGVDISNNFCIDTETVKCCDGRIQPTGSYPLGEITDGAENRFKLTCTIISEESVRLELTYISSDGSCSEIVGQCGYSPGFNKWGLYSSDDSINNCFLWSYWTTQNDRDNPDEWDTNYFDTINCKEIGGPPPQQLQHFQASSKSSPIGLTSRHFKSTDGPGGQFGDILIDIQYNERLQPLDLPIGKLEIDVLIPCDNDNDGDCDSDDFVFVTNAIGTCEGDSDYNEPADADHDGCVTEPDLKLLFCLGDFNFDKDVDGDDLANYTSNSMGVSLEDFADNFGRTNCP